MLLSLAVRRIGGEYRPPRHVRLVHRHYGRHQHDLVRHRGHQLASARADNRLTVDATGIVPGDTIHRRAKVTDAGTQNLASVTLTTTAGTSNVLTTDTTNGAGPPHAPLRPCT